ncbi:hypothetical protein HK405_016020 [Cladochytrium tenue]|nr:hypothetical protein HK405_016020 [Cladochytrium tenue]
MIGSAHAAGTTGAVITGITHSQPVTAAAYAGGMYAAKEVANQFADKIPSDQEIWKSTKKAGAATGRARATLVDSCDVVRAARTAWKANNRVAVAVKRKRQGPGRGQAGQDEE